MKISALLLAALCLCGCDAAPKDEADENKDGTGATWYSHVEVRTVRGHDYIIFGSRSGCSALHAESCPCKEGGDE